MYIDKDVLKLSTKKKGAYVIIRVHTTPNDNVSSKILNKGALGPCSNTTLVQKTIPTKGTTTSVVTNNEAYIVLKYSKDLIIYTNDCNNIVKCKKQVY